jgi:hypothetical protein
VAKDNKPSPNGTWCATFADKVILYWDQCKYQRTILLDQQGSNVATIRSAPGYDAYTTFCNENDQHDDNNTLCYDVNMVSDIESDNEVDSNNDDSNNVYIRTTPLTTDYSLSNNSTKHASTTSNAITTSDMLTTHVIEDEEDRQTNNHSAEFLHWHH